MLTNQISFERIYNIRPTLVHSNLINLRKYRFKTTNQVNPSFSKTRIPEDVLEDVKEYLKENHKELVRESFGNKEKKEELSLLISEYISSKEFLEKYQESVETFQHDELVDLLVDSIAGLDVLEELLKIPTITDININSYDDIWVDDYQVGPYKTNIKFESRQAYEAVLNKLINQAGVSWSVKSPQISGALPNLRFDIVGFDISEKITTSLRIFAKELRISEESLVQTGQASEQMVKFLKLLMKVNAKILVSGPTGSGKTELIKLLIGFIPDHKRIISIEDLKELMLKELYPNKNIAEWLTRVNVNSDDPDWDYGELIRVAMRHYPKWLVIGECRGPEVYHMIKSGQTGHNFISSIHASDAQEQIDRMIALMHEFAPGDDHVYGQRLTQNINVGIHLERIGKNQQRTITKIVEFIGYENKKPIYNTLFEYNREKGIHVFKSAMSDRLYKLFVSEGINLDDISFMLPKQTITA